MKKIMMFVGAVTTGIAAGVLVKKYLQKTLKKQKLQKKIVEYLQFEFMKMIMIKLLLKTLMMCQVLKLMPSTMDINQLNTNI